MIFIQHMLEIGLQICMLVNYCFSFKIGMLIDTAKLYILFTSLDDSGLHSRSQEYEKCRTCVPSFLL